MIQGQVVTDDAEPADVAASDVVVEGNEPAEPSALEELFGAIKMGKTRKEVDAWFAKVQSPAPPRDGAGHTLAHWAAKRGDVGLLEKIITKWPANVDVASADDVGMRPLHWACTEGRLGCARLLVSAGADVDARDNQGCTPLVVASQWGQADAAAYLVKVGADWRIFDRHDDSALHWAAYKGNVDIVGLLHHLGLPIDEPDAYGQTPLHLAALRGNLGACEYLLVDVDEKVRLAPTDKKGKTPLELATDRQQHHVRRFLERQQPLCERGAWAFARDKMTLAGCVEFCLGGGEAMRWPWFAMVFNKVLAQFLYVTLFLSAEYSSEGGPAAIRAPAWVHAAALTLQAVCWVAFLSCWLGDPGYLAPVAPELRRAYDAYFDRLVTGADPGAPVKLCHSCHIARPLRSKHCRVARQCVAGFDHYCPYVGTTVGALNYRWFFLYCVAFTAAALQWQAMAVLYLRDVAWDRRLIGVMAWFGLFILFGFAMITFHTQLVAKNLTTNESMNMGRYEHFRGPDGSIRNPFDRGLCNNVAEKMLPPEVGLLPDVQAIIRDEKKPLL